MMTPLCDVKMSEPDHHSPRPGQWTGWTESARWEGRLSCRPLRIEKEEDEEEGGLIVPPTPRIGGKKTAARAPDMGCI